MEKLVRVISQGAPQTRQWTNPNTGELKNITSVEVEMTDGLDRFIAEATDDLAIRYATLLMDYADEDQHTFDEIIIERKFNSYWLHFAVRPENNRRYVSNCSLPRRFAPQSLPPRDCLAIAYEEGESGGCHYKGGENRR